MDLSPVSLLRSRIESLLLVSDEPTPAGDLARVLDSLDDNEIVSVEHVRAELQAIAEEYDQRGSGFELREQDDAWRLYTRRANSDVVEAKLLDGTQQRLSRAALETLAVIAYRQPIARSGVAAIRAVNVDSVVRTLLGRGLITDVGQDPETGATLYGTTDALLEALGIQSLSELPPVAPLLEDGAEGFPDDIA